MSLGLLAIKIRVPGTRKSVPSQKVQENVAHHASLCLSWPYGVHMFASSSWTKWGYAKINIEINSGTAVSSFFSFSDSVITTWACHHWFLKWLWGVKDS